MMKTTITIFILLLGFLSIFPGCSAKKSNTEEAQLTLITPFPITDLLGNSREYILYTPEDSKPMPLIVYFHGARSDCLKNNPTLKDYTGSPVEETGLIDFCKKNKIALLVPEAKYEYEYLNCNCKGWSPFDKEIDGIEKIIDKVVECYPIAREEIYLAGISAGAVFCHHLANRRPSFYNAILSHSQGYIGEDNQLLPPKEKGPRFGVVFCYTRGDYRDVVPICINSEKTYRESGYMTSLLGNLPPLNHRWSNETNTRFLGLLKRLGQFTSPL